jgi:hypothetical protein
MIRTFLRSLKINARQDERKLIVFMTGITSIYGGRGDEEWKIRIVERGAISR